MDIREMRMSTFHCIQMFAVHPKNPLRKPNEIYLKKYKLYVFWRGKRGRGLFYGYIVVFLAKLMVGIDSAPPETPS